MTGHYVRFEENIGEGSRGEENDDGVCKHCSRPVRARGLCVTHYAKAAKAGEFTPKRYNVGHRAKAPCKGRGCSRPARSKGLCPAHRKRQKLWQLDPAKHPDPLGPLKVGPTQGPLLKFTVAVPVKGKLGTYILEQAHRRGLSKQAVVRTMLEEHITQRVWGR